jgi:hypothetical protein
VRVVYGSGFFVRPDGVVTGCLRRDTAGILLSEVDTDEPITTPPWPGAIGRWMVLWRERDPRRVRYKAPQAVPASRATSRVFWAILIEAASIICPPMLIAPLPVAFASS